MPKRYIALLLAIGILLSFPSIVQATDSTCPEGWTDTSVGDLKFCNHPDYGSRTATHAWAQENHNDSITPDPYWSTGGHTGHRPRDDSYQGVLNHNCAQAQKENSDKASWHCSRAYATEHRCLFDSETGEAYRSYSGDKRPCEPRD